MKLTSIKNVNINGREEEVVKLSTIENVEDKDSPASLEVVDTLNYLPTSRADIGTIGTPKYDFPDGKDTGDRTRVRMADKSLDITETDELLKHMKQDLQNKQKADENAEKEAENAQKKALLDKAYQRLAEGTTGAATDTTKS